MQTTGKVNYFILFGKGQAITVCLYAIIYLFFSFYWWEFVNPFKWVINIPNYHPDTRLGVLVTYLLYYAILYVIIWQNKAEFITAKEKEVESNRYYARQLLNFLNANGYTYNRKDQVWETSQRPNAYSRVENDEILNVYEDNSKTFLT